MRELEKYLISEKELWNGIHRKYRFPNGYGALLTHRHSNFGNILRIIKYPDSSDTHVIMWKLTPEENSSLSLSEVVEKLKETLSLS